MRLTLAIAADLLGDRPYAALKAEREGPIAAVALSIDDPTRLSARARRLVESGWRSSWRASDAPALSTALPCRRRTCSVEDAAVALAAQYGLDESELMTRAAQVRACYGARIADARVEIFYTPAPLASVEELDEPERYVERLAATPGLIAVAAPPVEVGAAPWTHMLCRGARRLRAAAS